MVSAAAPGNDATQVAVVFPAEVLTALGTHRFTGVVTLLFVKVNVTLPVGLVDPPMVGVTVAVKVTDWLTVDVEGTALSAVVVVAKPTG
jgi:hypothetical protein